MQNYDQSARPRIFDYHTARDLISKLESRLRGMLTSSPLIKWVSHCLCMFFFFLDAAKLELSMSAYIGELSLFRQKVDINFIAYAKQLRELEKEV